MIQIFFQVVLLFILLLCGCRETNTNTKTAPGGFSGNPCPTVGDTDGYGHICDSSSQWVAMLGGQCSTGSDCAFPYNACSSGKCTTSTSSGSQIWFATDAIRPGVTSTCNTTPCSAPNDYIYNIMAKGYDSLDDWCMSQAQQSTIPGMRNIKSWRALIIAQPDTPNATVASLKSRGRFSWNFWQNLASSGSPPFGPSSAALGFSSSNNTIYNKNGSPASSVYWSAWYGAQPNYCPATVQNNRSCIADVENCSCSLTTCRCIASSNDCSFFGPFHGDDSFLGNLCHVGTAAVTNQNILLGPFASSAGVNSWQSFGNNNGGGVFVSRPSGCGPGFDFGIDCGGGSTYNANGSQQKPIICIANQSS